MKIYFLIICLLANLFYTHAQIFRKKTNTWQTNGIVNSIVADTATGKIYIGGEFTYIGQTLKNGAILDLQSGKPNYNIPTPNGFVYGSAPDGHGGFYICGGFTMVGDSIRNHVAQIDSSGHVTGWNPDADEWVYSILVSGNRVYLGGEFITIGGQQIHHLAAVDATTGQPLSWNPNFFGGGGTIIYTLALSGGRIFVGGDIPHFIGSNQQSIWAFDTSTAQVDSFQTFINTNGIVKVLIADGNKLYVGGGFNALGTANRVNIAVLDINTGIATSFNTGANSSVESMFLHNGYLYIAGSFSNLGMSGGVMNTPRKELAAIDTATGAIKSWNPSAGLVNFGTMTAATNISTMIHKGDTIFICGKINRVNSQTRNYLAAIDINTGNLLAWNPGASAPVRTISISGSKMFVGGVFGSVGGYTRNGLACINENTDSIDSWDPNPISLNGSIFSNGIIKALCINQNKLYIAGTYNRLGGQIRNGLGCVNKNNGITTSWSPNYTYPVTVLTVGGGKVFVGGDRVHAIDDSTGQLLSWYPNLTRNQGYSPTVNSIFLTNNNVLIGGQFDKVNNIDHVNVVEVDSAGNLTNYSPNVYFNSNSSSNVLQLGSKKYITGDYTYYGTTGIGLALYDSLGQLDSTWQPNIGGYGGHLSYENGKIYSFSQGVYVTDAITGKRSSNHAPVSNVFAKGRSHLFGGGFSGSSSIWFTFAESTYFQEGLTICDISNPSYITNSQTICGGDSIQVLNHYHAVTGTYQDTIYNVNADSIIITNLFVHQAHFLEADTICNNDTLYWRGNIITSPGIYKDSLTTVMGCDSITSLNLIVKPYPEVFYTPNSYSFCNTIDSIALSGGWPPGGYYSGANVNSNFFYPQLAGLGPHIVNYCASDLNNCFGISTTTLNVGNGLATIITGGYNGNPGGIITSGKIYLFNADSVGLIHPIDSITLSVQTYNGGYFNSVPAGNYKIYVVPGGNYFTNTYYGHTSMWDSADVITVDCFDTIQIWTLMRNVNSPPGILTFGGTIIADASYSAKMSVLGDPIAGVNTYLVQIPGDTILGSAKSNSNGQFSFNNIPPTPNGYSYKLFADVPGFHLLSTYNFQLDSSRNDFNFFLSDSTIYIDSALFANIYSSVKQVKKVSELIDIKIYPNPANSELYINLSNTENINTISIYSITGQLLQKEKVTTKGIQRIAINDLASGIYFISIEKNTGEKVTKKFVKN